MRWRDRVRRIGAWLALFALLVQFALSFGHVHADALIAGGTGGSLAFAAGSGPEPDRSGGGAPAPHAHDACAICATIAQIGTLLLPSLPALTPPATVFDKPRATESEFGLTREPPSHVRPRAPPIA